MAILGGDDVAGDERARRVCAAQAGIEEIAGAPRGGLVFTAATEAAVGELTLALAESGALVLELSPRQATLEDLFFRLTERRPGASAEDGRTAGAVPSDRGAPAPMA